MLSRITLMTLSRFGGISCCHALPGHDSGLYTWQYLQELGRLQEKNWQSYLDRLSEAGYVRKIPSETAE